MYVCSECEYTQKKFFGLCPRCRGVGREATIFKTVQPSSQETSVFQTCFDGFNSILSTAKGFVNEQVVGLGASPGIGKSTLCSQIANEKTLYISTEESYNQVNLRFNRINFKKINILDTVDLETIIKAISITEASLIIIDSLNSINNTESLAKQAQNMNRIVSSLKKYKKIGIIICQVTKTGEIGGFNSILHAVDTVLYLEKSEVNEHIILYSTKNRFGSVGEIAMFSHTEKGLIESNIKIERKSEIGVSYTRGQFGTRLVDVSIEALVARGQGLRKVIGVPLSRVQQVLGIIDYYSEINFGYKDVYVNVSNGLNIYNISVDYAIANSILSSYYKIPSLCIDNLSGYISLNGKIKNGPHISEIIKKYKSYSQ